MERAEALTVIDGACERGTLDRTPVVRALEALTALPVDGEITAAVLRLAVALNAGEIGGRGQTGINETCVRLLSRTADRRALPVYRAAARTYLPSPEGDRAAVLRALALVAIHALEEVEARFLAARLLADGDPVNSGEPAVSAIAVLGAAGDDVALVLACRTVLSGDGGLVVSALEHMTDEVPPQSFWDIAAPLVGDRFGDATLRITDIVAGGHRLDLLEGFAAALVHVSDPDLMRAVLMSLVSARLDGLEPVFARVINRAPRRALGGVEDALAMVRLSGSEKLMERLQERLREPRSSEPAPGVDPASSDDRRGE